MLTAAGLVLLLSTASASQDRQPAASGESAVRHAVVEAVKARMGDDADVRVERLQFKLTAAPEGSALAAVPESGARLGRVSRFSLQWVPRFGTKTMSAPAGYVNAAIFVSVEHVRTARAIGRGADCEAADLVSDRGEVGAVLLQRLPRLSDATGATTVRELMADEVVTRNVLTMKPAVRSGDVVAIRAAAEGVTILGQAVAQQTGSTGDVIRVVNRESHRPLKARIVGPGKVEVVQ